ncbi:uncharacterized protein LOC144873541 [Branchiostoma floridae x Branchiostoma japonicum]
MSERRPDALLAILLICFAFVCGQQNATTPQPTEGVVNSTAAAPPEGAVNKTTIHPPQVIVLQADYEKRRISSPGYPDKPYPNWVNITWKIAVNHSLLGDDVVHLAFDYFTLEEGSAERGCIWDYVAVYNGNDQLKEKYCGTVLPPERTFFNNLTLVFISDRGVTDSGFSARYWTSRKSEVNVALRKRVSQSSLLLPRYHAERAADGNTGTSLYPRQECTHTDLDYEPWWKVDLGGTYVINHVTVFNRGDCCGERLRNFMVRIGPFQDILDNTPCGDIHQETPSNGEIIDVQCAEPISGRWVSVQLVGRTDYLSLCEVQVYAVSGVIPNTSPPPPIDPPEVFYTYCKELDIDTVTIPNYYGHRSVEEILKSQQWKEMETVNASCHPQIRPFLCSLLVTGYKREEGLPCWSWCMEVEWSCSSGAANGSSFEEINCWYLPATRCFNMESPKDCYYGNGVNYRGTGTLPEEGGMTCQNWTDVSKPEELIAYHWADPRENYCRNLWPDLDSEPICYTTNDTGRSPFPETCGLKPCTERGCETPPRVEKGSRSPVQNFYKIGETVTIICDVGYIIKEHTIITCTGDGSWSKVLRCVVNHKLRLQNALLASRRYSKKLAPFGSFVNVTFEAAVVEIIDADEKNENLFSSMSFRLQWNDNRLSWIPLKYGGLSELVVETTDVWIPNIYLQRNGDARFADFPDAPVTITSDGRVTWDIIEILLTTTCDLEPAMFPFDYMDCPVCLGGETDEVFHCRENNSVTEHQTDHNRHGEGLKACGEGDAGLANQWKARWTIDVTENKGCINMKFDRIPTFHLCTTLFPAIILSVLMCIIFMLPIEKGDRISFGMTILLSMVVSLVFITDVLPAKGSMPVAALLVIVYMCMMGFFLIITVIVIRISSSDKDLPPIVKKVFLRYIARLVFLGDLTQTKHGHTVLKVDDFEMAEGMTGNNSKPTEDEEPRHLHEVLLSLKESVNNLSDAVETLGTSGQPKTSDATEDEPAKTDYRQLARVLDRLCLILYVSGLLIAFPSVRYSAGKLDMI